MGWLGELSDNSIDFFEALEEVRPDLEGVMFAVCGLGDSISPDFCEGGRIWSRLLTEVGALRDRRRSRRG